MCIAYIYIFENIWLARRREALADFINELNIMNIHVKSDVKM